MKESLGIGTFCLCFCIVLFLTDRCKAELQQAMVPRNYGTIPSKGYVTMPASYYGYYYIKFKSDYPITLGIVQTLGSQTFDPLSSQFKRIVTSKTSYEEKEFRIPSSLGTAVPSYDVVLFNDQLFTVTVNEFTVSEAWKSYSGGLITIDMSYYAIEKVICQECMIDSLSTDHFLIISTPMAYQVDFGISVYFGDGTAPSTFQGFNTTNGSPVSYFLDIPQSLKTGPIAQSATVHMMIWCNTISNGGGCALSYKFSPYTGTVVTATSSPAVVYTSSSTSSTNVKVNSGGLSQTDNILIGVFVTIPLAVVILIIVFSLALFLEKRRRKLLKSANDLKSVVIPIDVTYNGNTLNSTSKNHTTQSSDYPLSSTIATYHTLNSTDRTIHSQQDPSKDDNTSLLKGRYRVIKKVGSGAFGDCFLCEDTKKGDQLVAIKAIRVDDSDMDKAIEECSKTMTFRHRRLVEVNDFFRSNGLGGSLCLVMKYYYGDLDSTSKRQILPESMIRGLIVQLGQAVDYLHTEKMILHRDIKPKNIFLESFNLERGELECVLGDYGEAKDMFENNNSVRGTLNYMAPEVLSKQAYGPKADVFSLGVTFYEIMAGGLIGSTISGRLLSEPESSVLEGVKQRMLKNNYSSQLIDFVLSMLRKNPDERPTAINLIEFTMGQGC